MYQTSEETSEIAEQTFAWPVAHLRQALATQAHGAPVYIQDSVPESPWRIKKGIHSGWGPGQLELCGDFVQDGSGLLAEQAELTESLTKQLPGVRALFVPEVPAGVMRSSGLGWKFGRQQALLEALRHASEGASCADGVMGLDNIFLSSILMKMRNIHSEEATLICNLLTLGTPTFMHFLKRMHEIRSGSIHSARRSFGNASRMPSSWWFSTSEQYQEHFVALPTLIRKENEGWVPSFNWRLTNIGSPHLWTSSQKLGDPVSETTTWFLARKRLSEDGISGVIEYSGLPSMPAGPLNAMTVAILEWLERAMDCLEGRSFATGYDAVDSGVIPNFKGMPIVSTLAEWEYQLGSCR